MITGSHDLFFFFKPQIGVGFFPQPAYQVR